VIAKCYRWGYRPWVTGYGDLATMHWTCTRLARADYCGDGVPHTRNGTTINVWTACRRPARSSATACCRRSGCCSSRLEHRRRGLPEPRALAADDDSALAALCPDRLVRPAGRDHLRLDTDALSYDPDALMFNEAYLNLGL